MNYLRMFELEFKFEEINCVFDLWVAKSWLARSRGNQLQLCSNAVRKLPCPFLIRQLNSAHQYWKFKKKIHLVLHVTKRAAWIELKSLPLGSGAKLYVFIQRACQWQVPSGWWTINATPLEMSTHNNVVVMLGSLTGKITFVDLEGHCFFYSYRACVLTLIHVPH